jgi:hypothetical protein
MHDEKYPIVVCDIDDVIADGDPKGIYTADNDFWDFIKCKPNPSGIRMLKELSHAGAKIILNTSRQGKYRRVTEKWLLQHNIPYDELYMDKPFGDIYIDDKNFAFTSQQLKAQRTGNWQGCSQGVLTQAEEKAAQRVKFLKEYHSK